MKNKYIAIGVVVLMLYLRLFKIESS